MRFEHALAAWGTADFDSALKQDMERVRDELPLQRALAQGSAITAAPLTVVVHHASATARLIHVCK